MRLRGRGSTDFDAERERMVREQLEWRGIVDPDVLAAMRHVPRERFVPPSLGARAYEDGALGIGGGQTISQPYIVARMTESLELPAWRRAHPDDEMRVLDVGTGSGYQAAILAALGARVISVERDAALADDARARLDELAPGAVQVVVGDGSAGWPEAFPYTGIVVAAAAPDVPAPLREQLAVGGALVLPVGQRDRQELIVVCRIAPDEWQESMLEPCVFVPLIGRHGFE